jgi:phage portal protein BeeE
VALVDRISSGLAQLRHRDASSRFSFDDLAEYLSFGGVGYPIVQTTMASVDREQVGATSVAALSGSSPVFALVLARLQAFSVARFQWTRFTGSQPGDLFGSPELDVLERPWPGGTTSDLLARMEIHVSGAGNAYVWRPRRDRLSVLRPDRVTIVMGSQTDADDPAEAPDVEVAGYIHTTSRGKVKVFGPTEIAHYAPYPDPNSVFLGMSWITPAIREYQADSLATEHKARFFSNAGTPNLAIKFDASITIEKVRAFKALIEAEHQGTFNAWKTLYLGGGADPVAVGSSFKDMDYAVIQGRAESRLAADAGVPPSWVGFSEGLQGSALNAGNFNSARRRFSDGTCYHLWANASTSLEVLLRPPAPVKDAGPAMLWFDSRVPFTREDASDVAAIQQQQAATIAALVRDGFIPETVIAAVQQNDFSLLKHTGWYSVQMQSPPSGQDPAQPAPPSANGAKPNGRPAGVGA